MAKITIEIKHTLKSLLTVTLLQPFQKTSTTDPKKKHQAAVLAWLGVIWYVHSRQTKSRSLTSKTCLACVCVCVFSQQDSTTVGGLLLVWCSLPWKTNATANGGDTAARK